MKYRTIYLASALLAAATILGDGRVALILDVDALVTTIKKKPSVRNEKRMAS